jgi:hypothetical protein
MPHAYRRKWATERKELPLKAVASPGSARYATFARWSQLLHGEDSPMKRCRVLAASIALVCTGACGDLDDPGAPGIDCNAERTPPAIAFLVPEAGATVTGTVNLTVNATDECGISVVRFLIGEDTLGRVSNFVNQPEPNTFTFTLPWDSHSGGNGPVTVAAEADDYAQTNSAGDIPAPNTGVGSRQFTVANP